jgi:hypothetical protein
VLIHLLSRRAEPLLATCAWSMETARPRVYLMRFATYRKRACS